MNAAELAALVAGTGPPADDVRASSRSPASPLLDNRLRIFVRRRGLVVQPTSVRPSAKSRRSPLIEQINRKLRQANYAKRIQ